jgi:hypothetical protein
MLNRGVVMLHYNARPHTDAAMQDLIATFGWEQLNHPPYSPDLVPSDFHVSGHRRLSQFHGFAERLYLIRHSIILRAMFHGSEASSKSSNEGINRTLALTRNTTHFSYPEVLQRVKHVAW